MNICIFGGTFDPPHKGHEYILDNLLCYNYDKIYVMPIKEIDYKNVSTSVEDRVNMLNLFLEKYKFDKRVELSLLEVERDGITYTCDTIKYYKDLGHNINFVIGTDSLNSIKTWKDYNYILNNCNLVVFNRGENESGIDAHFINNKIIDISSTDIREKTNLYNVDINVAKYIVDKQLYNLQKFIVDEMKVSNKFNSSNEFLIRKNYIKKILLENKIKKLVLGISGGQDSTLLGYIAARAVEELNLEFNDEYKLYLIKLPYGKQFDMEDVNFALKFINGINVIEVNIFDMVKGICDNINYKIGDFNKGNLKARIRMIVQYLVAGEEKALVLGTDHSAESITGFFTKFGDGGVDFNPLFGLNKMQGREILKSLGANKRLYEKIPTADLEDLKEGIADEIVLGVTYDDIDNYLLGNKVDIEIKKKIESLYVNSLHKRMPPKNIF